MQQRKDETKCVHVRLPMFLLANSIRRYFKTLTFLSWLDCGTKSHV